MDEVNLSVDAGHILAILGTKRRGQDHHRPHVDRPAQSQRAAGQGWPAMMWSKTDTMSALRWGC
ncbi:MAG: hypothetical protein MZV64_02210 [Ignavibacteriales bacterium]|nr:hypothetical protein [Ignavibacteriales bacterium]